MAALEPHTMSESASSCIRQQCRPAAGRRNRCAPPFSGPHAGRVPSVPNQLKWGRAPMFGAGGRWQLGLPEPFGSAMKSDLRSELDEEDRDPEGRLDQADVLGSLLLRQLLLIRDRPLPRSRGSGHFGVFGPTGRPHMPGSQLEFHHLTFVEQRRGVTVGRPDTKTYVVLPVDGAELLRRLAAGMPSAEAARWYGETFGEPVDVDDFVAALRELGFIRAAGEERHTPPAVHLPRLGRAAFSGLAWIVYSVVALLALLALTTHAELRPHAGNVFFTDSLIIVQLALAGLQIPAALWHELLHVLT